MSDRPQYGEYATPEEQAAASGVPLVPTPLAPPIAGTALPVPPPPGAVATTRPRWDSILTTVLLALGAYTVVSSFLDTSAVGESFRVTFTQFGFGEFTSTDAANRMGLVVACVQLVAYIITVALSMRSIRRNKVTFAIPLIAGVITTIVCALLLMSVVVNDPAYLTWIESQR